MKIVGNRFFFEGFEQSLHDCFGDFVPADVQPLNAVCGIIPEAPCFYEYSGTYGDDDRLDPGETSEALEWQILNIRGEGFAFRARLLGNPNPGGRIFTASGNELVSTEIGHTLAYWKDASLMLETRTAHGGKLTEYIETSADGTRLTMKIEIDRRDWKQIVYLDRVFNRVGDNNLKTTSH